MINAHKLVDRNYSRGMAEGRAYAFFVKCGHSVAEDVPSADDYARSVQVRPDLAGYSNNSYPHAYACLSWKNLVWGRMKFSKSD